MFPSHFTLPTRARSVHPVHVHFTGFFSTEIVHERAHPRRPPDPHHAYNAFFPIAHHKFHLPSSRNSFALGAAFPYFLTGPIDYYYKSPLVVLNGTFTYHHPHRFIVVIFPSYVALAVWCVRVCRVPSSSTQLADLHPLECNRIEKRDGYIWRAFFLFFIYLFYTIDYMHITISSWLNTYIAYMQLSVIHIFNKASQGEQLYCKSRSFFSYIVFEYTYQHFHKIIRWLRAMHV